MTIALVSHPAGAVCHEERAETPPFAIYDHNKPADQSPDVIAVQGEFCNTGTDPLEGVVAARRSALLRWSPSRAISPRTPRRIARRRKHGGSRGGCTRGRRWTRRWGDGAWRGQGVGAQRRGDEGPVNERTLAATRPATLGVACPGGRRRPGVRTRSPPPRPWHATRDPLAIDGAEARVARWVDDALADDRIVFAHPNHVIGAWAALMLHERSARPEYHELAQRAVSFMLEDAPRVEGSLSHQPDQLWVDTLFMCAPLLAHLGALDDRPELLDQAADEILAHARRLQDPATGLWYHGWSAVGDHNFAGAFWARGNGWAALSTSEVLRRLPRSHPRRDELLAVHRAQLRGLIRVQDPSGLWHTVVDQPEYYLETSGSAAITAALYRAISSGWLSADNLLFADAGRRAVEARIAADGTVQGVSAGTGVGDTLSIYNVIDRTEIKPYGQGLALFMLAAAEEASALPR